MEKSLFLTVQCIGFGLLKTVSCFPIDFSSVGTGEPNPLWLTSYFSAFGFLAIMGIIFGCVCCRNTKGFKRNEIKVVQEFTNTSRSQSIPHLEGFVNPTSNSELTIFPPVGANSSQIHRFEPLLDIKRQVPNLRPAAFSYNEQEISSQDWFSEPYHNFPRNHLKYVQEYGRGWFGRVVEGEAQNITTKENVTKVMVKILHEDATPTDQMYFLHEVKFYRNLKHPNILSLLGRCLETEPFLIILECYPNGDLKSFLSQNLASAHALVEQGVTLKMCSNITCGLQFMHENKFIHIDLAARNCLVGPDLTVKIGDYGNSIEIFKSDYYCAGSVALPVRWCAPESLKCTDVTIETREVTPQANIWSLAVVFWEICEFGKLPYAELNDDQVIVRVLGEKKYFLEKPNMFCLHKDELYHLMRLCWNGPLQRPNASQILVILDNLISSSKTHENLQTDSKLILQDFEQRWNNLKPNYIPKKDNTVEVDHTTNCSIFPAKLLNAKVTDSSLMNLPLGAFLGTEGSGQESPRFCLKSKKKKSTLMQNEDVQKPLENLNKIYHCGDQKSAAHDECKTVVETSFNKDFHEQCEKGKESLEFEYNTEIKPPAFLTSNQNIKFDESDVDSWLKGVEINNEEDKTFVRKISEAIRDLDATLAMEKTSSSEENSGKSSHQNSPGKYLGESFEPTVDFKLGSDTSSFINFTQKSFELSSLQNTEQPQSLNFTDSFLNDKKNEYDENYETKSIIFPAIEESREIPLIKSDVFDESLKENDSYLGGQSRNSSDTDDEVWRKRIERGEISEKVKEKSKSIANLMILTHIDASDESDLDMDKPFDRNVHRNSLLRSSSFAKSPASSNNFGSENDLTYAVLEDDFRESLKILSNNHKEHGHFDSLEVILPSSTKRENVWDNLFRSSEHTPKVNNVIEAKETQTDVNKLTENLKSKNDNFSETAFLVDENKFSPDNSNNFLGNVASEKLIDNNLNKKKIQDDASASFLSCNKFTEITDCQNNLSEKEANCDTYNKCFTKNVSSSDYSESDSSQLNENHIKNENEIKNHKIQEFRYQVKNMNNEIFQILPNKNHNQYNIISNENFKLSDLNENLHPLKIQNEKLSESMCKNKENPDSLSLLDSKSSDSENQCVNNNSYIKLNLTRSENFFESEIPEIIITNAKEDIQKNLEEEVFTPVVTKSRSFKFILKETPTIPEITISEESSDELSQEDEQKFELDLIEKQPFKHFKFILKDDTPEKAHSSVDSRLTESWNNNELSRSHSNLLGFENEFIEKELKDNNNKFDSSQNVSVIFGPCEDYTLDYFKGLKTTLEDISTEEHLELGKDKNLVQIIEDWQNKEANLDVWNKHLEKVFRQQLKNIDFDDVSFKSFGNDFKKNLNSHAIFSVKDLVNFIELEKLHTEKVEERVHINRITNLSEEEYDNFKLRTPDDERSSDSGFRDKGSLSESVEDGCEGKYNLEDIEAELEEAYVKGTFGNCEIEKEKILVKDSTNCNNFEYEESKFYEDESKNEDLNNIEGDIEFWNNKENHDYYFEISEFNPDSSQGWYLHPPDENILTYDRNVNEDVVNALRNELRESLPIQTRSFDEFNHDFFNSEYDDCKKDFSIQYVSDFGVPLSPIVEEQENFLNKRDERNIKNCVNNNNSVKIRKNIVNLMESVKSIDTNTFMQYLDYMIENEGRDSDDIKEIEEIGNENKESKNVSPVVINEKDKNSFEKIANFEEDIKNNLKIDCLDKNEMTVSETELNNCTEMLEDLESGSASKWKETQPIDDILIVDMDTNEIKLLESLKSKSYAAFETANQCDDFLEIFTDNSEKEALIFTPDLLSPDRERSLSEISRSSNETRTGDALSDITLSSPDLVPDCFSTSVQEISRNHEASEIINDLESSGIITNNISNNTHYYNGSQDSKSNLCSLSLIQSKDLVQNNFNFFKKDKHEMFGKTEYVAKQKNEEEENVTETPNTLEMVRKLEKNDLFEMSTSFIEEDNKEENQYLDLKKMSQKNESKDSFPHQKKNIEENGEDSYTADWESDSSEDEEISSSSGEFIWKDGDKESKLKAVQASDGYNEHCQLKKSQYDTSSVEIISNSNPPIECTIKEETSDDQEDSLSSSSTGSSTSINEFVPSAWNSHATPNRSAIKSPDKKVDQIKKNVWFKKQKYHCVYEYPREPSDNEDVDNTLFNQFAYEKISVDSTNKHFNFGVNTVELPNKHFPYGISNVIDYSSYTDWNTLEEEGDLSQTDTDSEVGFLRNDAITSKEIDFNFYNLNPFDFNNSCNSKDESEFYVSSSSRPFQGRTSSQFFPGNSQVMFFNEINNSKNSKSDSNDLHEGNISNNKEFITPDSGVEDSINDTPLEKQVKLKNLEESLEIENPNIYNGVPKLLENFRFSFNPEIIEYNLDKTGFETNQGVNELFTFTSNSPVGSMSPSGLGELRHTRDRLKLDLTHNHNVDISSVTNKKNQKNSLNL